MIKLFINVIMLMLGSSLTLAFIELSTLLLNSTSHICHSTKQHCRSAPANPQLFMMWHIFYVMSVGKWNTYAQTSHPHDFRVSKAGRGWPHSIMKHYSMIASIQPRPATMWESNAGLGDKHSLFYRLSYVGTERYGTCDMFSGA